MTTPTPHRRWYHLTPTRFFIGLLVVQVVLFLSERFQWFAFNEKKGWTVLVAVGVVLVAVVVMLAWGLVCLCLRWRFQFGVRSLLVFLLALSVPLGWFAWEMDKARRQREAVEMLTTLHADVFYDYDLCEDERFAFSLGQAYYLFTGRHWPHYLDAEPQGPKWLRDWVGDDYFRTVVAVELEGDEARNVTANHVQQIGALRNLTRLSLDDANRLTDSDLAPLRRLTRLERLFLANTAITDAGLQNLARLTELRYLSLAGTGVTDQGLIHLQQLSKLEMLELSNTSISDAGLSQLRPLKALKVIYLDGTLVTQEGVTKLQRLLPGCAVLLTPPGLIG
jgi:hypothetical protein